MGRKNPRGNLVSLVLAFAAFVFAPAAAAQTLRIYHIDVEQGDATLVVSPSGNTLLVDSGKNHHGARLKAAMDTAGVSRIDAFVCTHYHEDHCGGIDELVVEEGVAVIQTYDRGEHQWDDSCALCTKAYERYRDLFGQDAEWLRPGDYVDFDSDVAALCISSSGVVIGEDNPTPGSDENDMSISLLVTYGTFRYFVGADIEHPTERDIAERDLLLDVDVYRVSHHGSNTSSWAPLLRDMRPTVAIISNGSTKTYQHPRQVTLDSLAALAAPPVVFQTNKYLSTGTQWGNVPDSQIADLEQGDKDGTVLVEVDLGAGSYAVSFGGATFDSYPIKGAQETRVVIASLLPDPVGRDIDLEQVTLRNVSQDIVSLVGWYVADAAERIWDLSELSPLAIGESRTVTRNGRPMSLNNSGDVITLYDPSDTPQDRFQYATAVEGAELATGH